MEKDQQIFYIQTSKKNYFINLLISFTIAFSFSYLLYIQNKELGYKILASVVLFVFIFVRSYRIFEYLLTKRAVSVISLWMRGDEEKKEQAKKSFIWNIVVLLFLIFGFIIYLLNK